MYKKFIKKIERGHNLLVPRRFIRKEQLIKWEKLSVFPINKRGIIYSKEKIR